MTDAFDTVMSQHQRVLRRFGTAKKRDALSIQIDQAKSLRGIKDVLVSIYDVTRYQVLTPCLFATEPLDLHESSFPPTLSSSKIFASMTIRGTCACLPLDILKARGQ